MKQSNHKIISIKNFFAFILLTVTLVQSLDSVFSFFHEKNNNITLVEIEIKNENSEKKSEEKVEIENLIFQRKIISIFSQSYFTTKFSWKNYSTLWFNIEADVLLQPPEQLYNI